MELAGPDDWQCNAVEGELDKYSEHPESSLSLTAYLLSALGKRRPLNLALHTCKMEIILPTS